MTVVARADVPLVGAQQPRILVRPAGAVSSAASEVIDLCEQAGLVLDPWQKLSLDVLLAEAVDGKSAARNAALIVPRQNGKGAVLEALELGWLFLFKVPLISHSAHKFKTAQEAYLRLRTHIEGNDWLRRRVKKMPEAHGQEGVITKDGSRLLFLARAGGGSGRGFSADRQVLDEAYDLPDMQLASMMPTLSARPDTQLIFTSSAGMAESATLRRIRQRGLAGDDRGFAYLEWSVDSESFDPADEAAWALANPGYGIRIFRQAIEDERSLMSEADFARERLGVWDEATQASAFDMDAFARCVDPAAAPGARVVFAADASPDGASAAIVAADGAAVEVVAHADGMGWLFDEAVRLCREHRAQLVVDPAGPIGALVPKWQALPDLDVVTMSARDLASACGGFAQALTDGAVRIRTHDGLAAGMAAARKRPMGDAWALRRVGGDICPVVAAVAAHWGATRRPEINLVDQIF